MRSYWLHVLPNEKNYITTQKKSWRSYFEKLHASECVGFTHLYVCFLCSRYCTWVAEGSL